MAAINNDKVITELNQKEEENKSQEECSSQEESDFEEDVYEDIVLDEASDTEDYKPPLPTANNDEDEENDGDDDASSGDEEVGVHVQEVAIGKSKLLKLKFDDVEEKRKEFLHEMDDDEEEEESEEEQDKENIEDNSQEKSELTATANEEASKAKFDDYRNILDEDMADYNSDDDGHFNPVYCGETLSDVEYQEDDERNTESEPEIEEQGENFKHKRTGEPLVCIRMMEDLELPPDCSLAAAAASPNSDVQNAMECA